MKNNYSLILLIFLILFSSCSSMGPVFKYKEEISRKIIYNSSSLEILDQRKNVSNKSIYLNPYTYGGEENYASPKLPIKLNSIYTSIIEKFKEPGKNDIKVVIEILEAYQRFRANGVQEFEYVSTKLKLKIIDLDSGNVIKESEGESWGEKKTLDANNYSINKMFLTSLEQALIIALNKE